MINRMRNKQYKPLKEQREAWYIQINKSQYIKAQ